MRVAILVFTISFALMGCNGGPHKGHIARNGPQSKTGLPDKTGTSGEMTKPGQDSDGKPVTGCLNLLKVVSTLTKKSDNEYTVYTSNMDLGTLAVTPGPTASCLKFEPEPDTVPKAAVFLQKSSVTGPAIALQSSVDILGSPDVAGMLAISGQKECTSVKFKNESSLDVVCKDVNGITLKVDANSYVQYAIGVSSLTITYFTPVKVPSNCQNTNPKSEFMSKVERVITWAPSQHYTIDAVFGELLHRYVAVTPTELQNIIDGRNPKKTYDLSLTSLFRIYQQFDQGDNQLKCSPLP